MEIRPINKNDSSELYYGEKWFSVYKGALQCMGIFNSNQELVGSFLLQRQKIRGQLAFITPYFISNNVLKLNNPASKNHSKIAHEKKVFDAIADFIDSEGARIIDMSFPIEFNDMQAFVWKGFSVKPRYTYQLDLRKSNEELLAGFDSTTRSNLNKAKKELNLVNTFDPEESLKLCDLTFGRQKMSYSREHLSRILKSEELKPNRESFFVNDGQRNIAVVEMVFDQGSAYYLIGAYDHHSKHRGANTLAMWGAIEAMKQRGVALLDFQGSMIPAIEKFIRGFGGDKKAFFSIQKFPWYYGFLKKLKGK